MLNQLNPVLAAFGINPSTAIYKIISSGLINPTWKIISRNEEFILQRINTEVFKQPEKLASNTRLLAEYAAQHYPDYLFVSTIPSIQGLDTVIFQNAVYRLFPFVKNSHTITSVATIEQAYGAAFQFGKFTNVFSEFDTSKLNLTIPDFHNLSYRFQQFTSALQFGNPARIKECSLEIKQIGDYLNLVEQYKKIVVDPNFKLRVTHHDTKISNVLFDEADKSLCVIDLDTVMPGYFVSDVGDMIRTYLSPTTEEESDFSKIQIRNDFFQSIVEGYLTGINGRLSATEMRNFFYAGPFLIYMQALRFLTDYLLNDVYYGAGYEKQNLMRSRNQLYLLNALLKQQPELMRYL